MKARSSALIFSDGAAGPVIKDPPRDLSWQDLALCAQGNIEIFFPEKGGSTAGAKKICRACEVRAECLEYALSREASPDVAGAYGIWGGFSAEERKAIRRERRRRELGIAV